MVLFGKLSAAASMIFLCVFLLRSRCSLRKLTFLRQAVCYGGGWLFLSTVALFGDHILIRTAASILFAGFLYWHLGKAAVWKAVLFGLLFGVLHAAATGAGMLFRYAFPAFRAQCVPLLEITVLYALVVLATLFHTQWRSAPVPLLSLIPVWLVAVLLCEECIRNRNDTAVAVLEFLAYIWVIYAGCLLRRVSSKIEAQLQTLLEKQQKAHHYALKEEYYQQLRDKQTETRALWHDLNKYLRAAKAEAPSAQALDQLEAMLNSATQIVDVGNQVLNVILNEYAQTAKAAGIDLRLKVQVPQKLTVSVADLYILIGNTMDNAIEACKALPAQQRVIDLTLRTHNDVLYYKLTNPYVPAVKRSADPMRGHGLQNVRRCVESYSGSLDIIHEDGFFTVTAHLNQG